MSEGPRLFYGAGFYSLSPVADVRRTTGQPPKEAPTIRNFTNQESICSPLKPTQKNTSSFFGDPGRQGGKNACFDAVGKGIGLTPSVTAPKRASDAVPPPRRGG